VLHTPARSRCHSNPFHLARSRGPLWRSAGESFKAWAGRPMLMASSSENPDRRVPRQSAWHGRWGSNMGPLVRPGPFLGPCSSAVPLPRWHWKDIFWGSGVADRPIHFAPIFGGIRVLKETRRRHTGRGRLECRAPLCLGIRPDVAHRHSPTASSHPANSPPTGWTNPVGWLGSIAFGPLLAMLAFCFNRKLHIDEGTMVGPSGYVPASASFRQGNHGVGPDSGCPRRAAGRPPVHAHHLATGIWLPCTATALNPLRCWARHHQAPRLGRARLSGWRFSL